MSQENQANRADRSRRSTSVNGKFDPPGQSVGHGHPPYRGDRLDRPVSAELPAAADGKQHERNGAANTDVDAGASETARVRRLHDDVETVVGVQ
jgi:hypothetical protein